MYKNDNLLKLEKFIDEFINEQSKKYENNQIVQMKIDHIKRTAQIAKENFEVNHLLRVAMKFHDIGRFKQYDLIGNFDDKIFSHNVLGNDIINQYIDGNRLENTNELEMIKAVILYHGGAQYMPENIRLGSETLELVELSHRIDALDNGCMGALTYIEKECLTDAKNYRKMNPNLEMNAISSDVLNLYLRGETFDKLYYCKTYADYLLFAASLAIQSLKSPEANIARKIMSQKCGKYENALVGYKDLFEKYIDSTKVNECFRCLFEYYCKKNEPN